VTLVITPEDAAVRFTGEASVDATAPLTLRAQVVEPDDGSPGDLRRAAVFFELADGAGATSSYGPVAVTMGGEASYVLPGGLPAGAYTVVVRLDSSGGFYHAPLTARTPPPAGPTCAGLPATIVGTAGRDKLRGTAGDDVIVGLGGSDLIDGRGGNDVICGGDGHDQLSGGDGDDQLVGGAGTDRLDGGSGANLLDGGRGDDRLEGGYGDDTLEGNSEDDTLDGGRGDYDALDGGDGDDSLRDGDGVGRAHVVLGATRSASPSTPVGARRTGRPASTAGSQAATATTR
jgi:Ca2+-binding RTX toxin-like protein